MLLKDKNAVIYGGGGAVGGAIARAFAREGARVHLAGRTLAPLEKVAGAIRADGGVAEVAQADALEPEAVEQHLANVVGVAGRIDILVNATSLRGDLQGTPLLEMPAEDFTLPILTAARTNFLTATAAARHMVKGGSGVILMLSTSAAVLSGRDRRYHLTGGFSTACAATEAFARSLAGELGPRGVRVLCLRPDALPETWGEHAEVEGGNGPKGEVWRYMEGGTALGRLPALAQVANAAVFAASDFSGAMTGTVLNLTCGSVMD